MFEEVTGPGRVAQMACWTTRPATTVPGAA
ncbi:hypothetical protein B0I32_101694 [Nonomuraea fuscirosea]|uniref:Uncharacterized protein n=1 Tax=Nonomuraea fuscirosea TaxID=1291556 RepID=A0A2T0NC62_9ACTN|nr:hypothetical protein B0I32_101694 [Nonomuraea fuscirosea]